MTVIQSFTHGFRVGLGDKSFVLNPNPWLPWGRTVKAIAMRGRPWYHRNLYFSCVTGEQVGFEAVQPLGKKTWA